MKVDAFVGDAFILGLPITLVKEHIRPKMQELVDDVLGICDISTRFKALVSIYNVNS